MPVIAIDIGYSHVKAVHKTGKRAIFSSVVAPARELAEQKRYRLPGGNPKPGR